MEQVSPFTQAEVLQFENMPTGQEFRRVLLLRGKCDTLAHLLLNLYSQATDRQWDATCKCSLLNLALTAVRELVGSHSKEGFLEALHRTCQGVGRRDGNYQRLFDEAQVSELQGLLQEQLLPYYELYRITFDRHFHFRLQTATKQAVGEVTQEQLGVGTAVEVEGVVALQEFIGIRQPKEEKKDPKKK